MGILSCLSGRTSVAVATAVVATFCFSSVIQSASAQSLEQIIQQQRQVEQQLSRLQTDRINPLADELEQQEDFERAAQGLVDAIRGDVQDQHRAVRDIERSLRRLADRQFVLSFNLVELKQLFDRYKNASTNEEAINTGRLILRATRGLHTNVPRRLEDIDNEVLIERLKFDKRLVAVIGPALVGIGNLVVSIVSTQRLIKTTGGLANLNNRAARNKAILKISEKVAEILGKASGIPTSTKQAAEFQAKDLAKIAREKTFGNADGRAGAQAAIVESRRILEGELSRQSSVLSELEGLLAEAEAELEKEHAEVEALREQLKPLEVEAAALEQQIVDLRQKSQEAQTRDVLAQSTGRRHPVSTSLGLNVAVGGGFRGPKVAVDDVSAAVLGLDRRLPFSTGSVYEIEQRVTCEICERRNPDSEEVICRPASHNTFVRRTLRTDPDGRVVAEPGNIVTVRGNSISAARPGEAQVQIRHAQRVTETRTVDAACGRARQVVLGTPGAESSPVTVEALQVENIRLNGGFGDGRRVDLFTLAPDTDGFVRRTGTTVGLIGDVVGAETRAGQRLEAEINVRGRTRGLDFTNRARDTEVRIDARGGGGDAELRFDIVTEDGQRVDGRNVKVTSSEFSARIRQGDEAGSLFLGQRAIHSVDVVGAADTGRLRVQWTGFDHQGEVTFEKESRFSGSRASTAVLFQNPDLINRTFQMTAEVFDGGDQIAQLNFPELTMRMRISDMRFVLAGSDIGVEALDIFTPSDVNSLPGIEVQVRDQNRDSVSVPRGLLRFQQIGLPILQIGARTTITGTVVGRASASTTDVGSAILQAELDLATARDRGIVFIGQSNSATLRETVLLTLNRLFIERQSGDSGEEFVLKAVGPGRFEGYRVTFLFAGGETVDTSFEAGAFGAEARVPAAGRRFVRADVARQTGRVVGSISADLDGAPLPPPSVRLEIPPEGGSGNGVVVRAFVENILNNDSFDLRCEWSVDPALGAFRDAVTNVSPTGETGGICVNNLTLSDDPANVNREVEIDVTISRQIGPGERS
jgi:uncharacterized coiled-coil protein SlyX